MFYSVIIRRYFSPDENNPPDFHVYYNEVLGSSLACPHVSKSLPTSPLFKDLQLLSVDPSGEGYAKNRWIPD